MRPTARPTRTWVNYVLDATIFVAFLFAFNMHVTGQAVHEWLGIAFGAAILAHLLLHWQWIVNITRRLFGRVTGKARLNYAVNLLFFLTMVLVIFTGIMISKSVTPALGLSLGHNMLWRRVHTLASDAALILVGVHLALHWRWVVNTTRRLFRRRRLSPPAPALTPVAVKVNTMVGKGSQI